MTMNRILIKANPNKLMKVVKPFISNSSWFYEDMMSHIDKDIM